MVERLKVYLVLNNEADAKWYQSSLKQIPMESIHLKTFKQFEKAIEKKACDVIIASLTLPDKSGIDCIRKIKSNYPDIPIVVSVPAEQEKQAYEGVLSGAQGFIRVGTLGPYSVAAVIYQAFQRQNTILEIQKSQRQLENLVSNLPGFVYRCLNDVNWTMEYISEGCKDLTGYSPSDFQVGTKMVSYNSVIHPDDRDMVRKTIQKAIKQKTHFQIEYRIRTASGEEKWFWEQGNAVDSTLPKEEIILEGFITDITARKIREIQMQSIIRVGAVLRNAIRASDFSSSVTEEIRDLYNSDCAAIIKATNQPGIMRINSSVGVWDQFEGKEVDIKDCISRFSLQDNKTIVYDKETSEDHICRALDCGTSRFMAFVPLISQKKARGIIALGRDYRYSPQELDVLEAIANMIVSALERSDLYQKTEKQLRRLESLHAIDQAITSVYDLKVINSIILDQVCKELEADAADILILNKASNMLEYKGIRGFVDREISKNKVPLTTSLAGNVLLENTDKSIADLNKEPLKFIRSSMGVEKFKAYYAKPLSNKGEIIGVMELFFRKHFYPDEEWENFFETIATQTAVAYDSYRKYSDLQRMQQNMTSSFRSTLETWSKSLELHDIESQGHIRRVTDSTIRLARELGVEERELLKIERGALLHDIGKIGIMDEILQKKGTLTEKEWDEIKKHPQIARDLLSNVKILEDALDIPYSHHENWDGSGYPQGLQGEQIPLSARIFSVVETFDAVTSPRPYSRAWTKKEAIKYLKDQKGKKFDPVVVDKFLKNFE